MAYQQQVDDMFFYDYHCCMKKHDITDDIPSIPFNDEDEAIWGDKVALGDDSITGEGSMTGNDSIVVEDEV